MLLCPLRKVASYVEDFQSRTSDNIEEVRTRLSTYGMQVRDNAQAKITTLNELLKTQVEAARERMEVVAEDIRDRFGKTTTNMRSTMEDKMEELRDWFQSFVSMFSM